MCLAPGQITVILCVRRAATSQPGRIAANLKGKRAQIMQPDVWTMSTGVIMPGLSDSQGLVTLPGIGLWRAAQHYNVIVTVTLYTNNRQGR